MKTVQINVRGLVQGVGFRYSTKAVADRLKVAGWVRNEEDGSVTIQAQASKEILENFINLIKASPSPAGRVSDMRIIKIDPFDRTDFIVKY